MLAAIALLTATSAPAATIERNVRAADAAFWQAFNRCDRDRMAAFLAPDVEFYHDKTGVTIGRERVVASFMNGPCGTPSLRVRRAAVDSSIRFDPVPGYGAILTGRHLFYARSAAQPERLDGEAAFAVVWEDRDGAPKMRRILSYAHGPAAPPAIVGELHASLEALRRFVGRYASPQGDIVVTIAEGGLRLDSGSLHLSLAAVAPAGFQARERALGFNFLGSGETASAVAVREDGRIVTTGQRRD